MAANIEISNTQDDYVLNRGLLASTRLNLQHYLLKQHLGYLIHPRILENLPEENVRIADVGTGTGIWLLDVASVLPASAQLDGFDISSAQYPIDEWLPKNVKMSTFDALKPVPSHLVGKFDAINIRLFLLVVRGGDATPIIHNVLKMLKPGGYVQWSEFDFSVSKFVKANPGSSTEFIEGFWELMASTDEQQKSQTAMRDGKTWVENLDADLERSGLENVFKGRYHLPLAYHAAWLDVCLLTWEELTHRVIDRQGAEAGQKARQFLKSAYEDGKSGGMITTDIVTVVAQKPMATAVA